MSNNSQRVSWIDVNKGIGIILVILGHLIVHDNANEVFLKTVIQSFHMPLFFFMSGYFIKIRKELDYKDYTKNKIKTLIIPYICFATISFAYWIFKNIITNQNIDLSYMIKCLLCLEGRCGFNDPLWFLLCLFIIEMIFSLLLCNSKSIINIDKAFVFSIIIGILYSFIPVLLPFKIDVAGVMFPFFLFGYVAREKNIIEYVCKHKKIFFTLVILNLVVSQYNGMINIYGGEYYNVIFMYIAAFTGIISISVISMKINHSRVLEYIGRNSLLIMATHFFVFDMFRFIGKYILKVSIMEIEGIIPSLFILLFTILIYIPVIPIVNKFFGFAVGKYNKTN